MNLCKKVSRKLGLLSRLRKVLGRNASKDLYTSIIQPNLDYAVSVWGYSSVRNSGLIKRLQHRAARIVTGNRDYINTRGADLVSELGWQTIEQRRNYYTATLMYKCVNETAPRRLVNELVMSSYTHDISTRSTQNLKVQVPYPNCEMFRNSFKYQGAVLWNSLPAQLRSASDLNSFKRLYKHIYFK